MMEKRIIQLLFFSGVIPLVFSSAYKYYLVQQTKTWSEAQTYCQANNSNFAIISNADNIVQLQAEAQQNNLLSSAWVGLYVDINSWRWSYDNETLGSYNKWGPSQPNNSGGKEECGGTTRWIWFDSLCTLLKPFLCFDARLSGNSSYIYYSESKTWRDAQSYCRQYHTDFASARNQTENTILQKMVVVEAWFGLFRDTWEWLDQTNVTAIKWSPQQPDNALGNENCGIFLNDRIADDVCSELKPFFCSTVVGVQKKIFRLKVQSLQDVNDPMILATILDKIKEKLKGPGLNVSMTVKWKVNPSGAVFKIPEGTM